jgi:hypothetical protein
MCGRDVGFEPLSDIVARLVEGLARPERDFRLSWLTGNPVPALGYAARYSGPKAEAGRLAGTAIETGGATISGAGTTATALGPAAIGMLRRQGALIADNYGPAGVAQAPLWRSAQEAETEVTTSVALAG